MASTNGSPTAAPECSICHSISRAGTLPKRLIVCCDGTSNASDKGVENNATNIARLSRVCANVGHSHDGVEMPQIVYYQSGVATGTMSTLSSIYQAGFGEGLDEKVTEAYNYLVNNYGPGDEVLVFGFSRGAYTARSLASFVCQVGLLMPAMMDYFDEIWKEYKHRRNNVDFEESAFAKAPIKLGELGARPQDIKSPPQSRWEYITNWAHTHVKVKVVGVFDTVGSLGMSGYVDQPGTDVTYQSTTLHWKIENAFHAIALDETRGNFAPTLFYLDDDVRQKAAAHGTSVRLRQCWFPGYHGDVGGHSDADWDTNSVDEITFAWMVDQLERYGLLQFSRRALQYPILDRIKKPETNNNAPNPKNPEEVMERRILWSDGILRETQSLFYKVASSVATRRLSYIREPGVYYAVDDNKPISYTDFNETIHPCVWHRMQNLKYQPKGLNAKYWTREVLTGGKGAEWVRREKGREEVRLKEYVIPKIEKRDTKHEGHWTGSLEREIAPGTYLGELDEGNGGLSGKDIEDFF